MRVNLIAQPTPSSSSQRSNIPVSLTIRPACGLPGDYEYRTDSTSLLRMLRQKTDVPSYVIDRFQLDMQIAPSVRLSGVNLSERLLTEIGYFLD